MTVKQLIEILEQFPEEYPVMIEVPGEDYFFEPTHLKVDDCREMVDIFGE